MILRDHGMSKTKRYWHDLVGFNYRLTNLQASIGLAQLEKLNSFVNKKIQIAQHYIDFFSKYDFFEFQNKLDNSKNSYWLFSVLIKDNAPFTKNEFIDFLKRKGIDSRPLFFPLHSMPIYKNFKRSSLKNSIDLSAKGVSLPSFVDISRKEIKYILENIKNLIHE